MIFLITIYVRIINFDTSVEQNSTRENQLSGVSKCSSCIVSNLSIDYVLHNNRNSLSFEQILNQKNGKGKSTGNEENLLDSKKFGLK